MDNAGRDTPHPVIELGVRPGVADVISLHEIVSRVTAGARDTARALPELVPDGLSFRLVAAVVLVGWVVLAHLLGRWVMTSAVRKALLATNPDTRRAAVLVAAHHGLGPYAGVLSRWVATEALESVLLPLAEVVCDPRERRRGRRRNQLRGWAEDFFEARAAKSRERAEMASSLPICAGEPGEAGPPVTFHAIDALLAVEQPVAPALEPPRAGPAERRRRWRACPDELDALKVLEGLGGRPRTRRRPLPELPEGEPGSEKVDLDALVDALAGVQPPRRPVDLRRARSAGRARVRTVRPPGGAPRVRPALQKGA